MEKDFSIVAVSPQPRTPTFPTWYEIWYFSKSGNNDIDVNNTDINDNYSLSNQPSQPRTIHLVQHFFHFLKKINFGVKGVGEHRDKRCQFVNIFSIVTKMNLGGVGEHRESETND